jgi:hypothetical protein
MFGIDFIKKLISKELEKDTFDRPLEAERKSRIGHEKFVAEHIIDYEGGHAYIGFAKTPLMKSVSGIGFQGVKLQTPNRDRIQCHECGKWQRALNSKHLKTHELTTGEYKEKYGFNKNTGLVSDKHSIHLRDRAINNKNLTDSLKKKPEDLRKWNKDRGFNSHSMERMNGYGTCPEQLRARLINFINRFKRLPLGSERNIGYFSYCDRFGSMNNALKEYGLPTRVRRGRVTEYVFPDGSFLVKRDNQSYDLLYSMMLKKCPILSKAS